MQGVQGPVEGMTGTLSTGDTDSRVNGVTGFERTYGLEALSAATLFQRLISADTPSTTDVTNVC